MSENKSKEAISDGIVITIFEDYGPENIYNSSPLTNDEALNMAIKGMTAIGTDNPLAIDELRSYGPIPTPIDPYISIGFLFSLKTESSKDYRISSFGRIIVIWIITKSRTTLKYIGLYKQMIRRILRSYQINLDHDIRKEDILHKIDEKLKIIETGVDSYYISDNNTFEAFYNLTLVPINAPIMICDNNQKKISILLRERLTPNKKVQFIQLVNDFKNKIPKGSLYKIDTIIDEIIIRQLLSKQGLLSPVNESDHLRIRLTNQLTFEELDDFLEIRLNQIRHQLTTSILKAFEKKEAINLSELASQTGFTLDLIDSFVNDLINTNILQNAKNMNKTLIFH